MFLAPEEIIKRIKEGLQELFPETEQLVMTGRTTLGEMPEWDSMAAVNLQTFLLQAYDIEVPLDLLADETMLSEVADFLMQPVGDEAV